jgi:hypothetical protein
MPLVLIPAALLLLLYAPGRCLLPRGAAPKASGSRLLREVLLSACCTSWVGFALAEARIFSLPLLLVALAAIAGAGAMWTRGAARASYRAADLAGVGIAALTALWVAPPFDTRMLASDSAGYIASGVHLARQGSLIIHDPTLASLSPDLKRTLFLSLAPDRGAAPFLRLPGSFVLRGLDTDEVLPAFHHLIAVWIAALHQLGGSAAAVWTITLFAALSVWAVVEFARDLCGTTAAAFCCGILLLLAPQYWYSRFLMPEVPTQFFLWGGLCGIAWLERSQRRCDALLAGLAFGIAGLMRIETVGFAVAAVLAVTSITPRRARPHWRLMCLAMCAVWLHAGLHLAIFRTHYLGNLRSFVTEDLPGLLQLPWAQPALAAGLFTVAAQARTIRWSANRLAFGLAGVLWIVALLGDERRGWAGLQLLTYYGGLPLLLAGTVGLMAIGRSPERGVAAQLLLMLAALAFAQFMIAPHATPVPMWLIRRAVVVVFPALCVGAVRLCTWAAQARRWWLAVAIALLTVGAQGRAFLALRQPPYYRNTLRHVHSLAALIPSGARVLYDTQLVGTGLAETLWAERDLPAYFLAAGEPGRIRELLAGFAGAPTYWMSTGATAPPHGQGISATPIAFYEFVVSTPALDIGADPAAASTNWDFTIGLYQLRLTDGE